MEYDEVCSEMRVKPQVWLVTGVAGFIGSNLLEALLKLDQKVIGLDNFSTGKRANLEEVRSLVNPKQWERFSMFTGDVTHLEDCRQACQGVKLILHQAALGSVPRSIKDPIQSHQSNVTGVVNLLFAAKEEGIRRVVYASSSSVYGDDLTLPKVEAKIGKPLSPYAATKLADEIYADVFARAYGLETVGLRYFNVFGRRQDPDGEYAAVIPRWFKALIGDDQVSIFGDGATSRDFTYIDNVVQANLLAAAAKIPPAESRIYNVACGQSASLRELFSLIRGEVSSVNGAAAQAEAMYREFRPGDVRHSLADISLMKEALGYRPTHSLRQGLAHAAEWYIHRAR